MKFVFLTHCDSWLMDSFGGNKLIASFKYFHPDLEIVHLNEKYIEKILNNNPGFCRYSMMPLTMLAIKRQYKADYVCHLDADSLVLGRLDEILKGDYEIAGVRNNNDDFLENQRMIRPYPIRNIPNHFYLNCGCIATNSDEFLFEWIDLNAHIIYKHGINFMTAVEQDTYNVVAYSNYVKFNLKILDSMGSDLFYGCSANMHAKNNPIPDSVKKTWDTGDNWKLNNWGSWKDIQYKDGKFYLYNKIVKLVHQSGGGQPGKAIKLDWDLFNDETSQILKNILQIN